MVNAQSAKLIRLHFREEDRYRGELLYKAIVQRCRDLDVSGVTVFRGLEGYGESAEIERHRLMAKDQPIIVTIVETAANAGRLLPELEEMMDTGMIATSDVQMIRVIKASKPAEPFEESQQHRG